MIDPKPKQAPLSLWFNADHSGCGNLRSKFPNDILNNLYATKKKYEGIMSTQFLMDSSLFAKVKNIHFQRQVSGPQVEYIELVRTIKEDNAKVDFQIIYDLDDLFGYIPSYNGASKYYNQPAIQENIKLITNLVDIFTVSTYDLKKEIESLGGSCKVKIVPNYVPKFLYRPYEVPLPKNEKPKIVWAGSNTHFSNIEQGDFEIIYDLITNTLDEFDWVLMGMSQIPQWLNHIKGKVQFVNWIKSFNEFPSALRNINADFGVAPLLDNRFNRCKSNIKLLDYCSADTIAICSKVAPYKKEAQVFFSGDWKADRDKIIELHNDKAQKTKILNKQRRLLEKYYLENNVSKYKDLLNI